MFSTKLFKHKYDIDDVLRALCGDDFNGTWWLHTAPKETEGEQGKGELIPVAQNNKDTYEESEFWFKVEPLPFTPIQQELKNHHERARLTEEQQAELDTILHASHSMFDLFTAFNKGVVGGWLRERIKEEALEWLDERQMIPPSMRHVRALEDQPEDLTLHINTNKPVQ